MKKIKCECGHPKTSHTWRELEKLLIIEERYKSGLAKQAFHDDTEWHVCFFRPTKYTICKCNEFRPLKKSSKEVGR